MLIHLLVKPGMAGVQDMSFSQDVESVRRAIRGELVNKIVYDDKRVCERLRTAEVDDDLVKQCYNSFLTDTSVQTAVNILKDLEVRANRHQGCVVEIDMYPYLTVLFDYIRNFSIPGNATGPLRDFRSSTGPLTSTDEHTLAFPTTRPGFSVVTAGVGDTKQWRDRHAFVEVKLAKGQGPRPQGSTPTAVHEIVAQAADYARLHVSARPFVLFSVGLLIYGSGFCVGIFDRAGVTFSPQKDMWDDTEDFIRVVRSLACELTAVELGQDPSVRELDRPTTERLTGLTGDEFYPSFLVDPIGDDGRRWCTIGHPMWSSLSLLGRGTIIWRVKAYTDAGLSETEMILKTAWRGSKRDPESAIYQTVKGTSGGLARYLVGGDVKDSRPDLRVSRVRRQQGWDPREDTVITVRSLRGDAVDAFAETPVLHRLIIATVGRPLWTYTSDLELLKGMRAALDGHLFLWKQGILHRDISAGNILLAANPDNAEPGHEGFLTDLEFARVHGEFFTSTTTRETVLSRDGLELMERSKTKFTTSSAQRGAAMTGTLQFMAVELLTAINATPTHMPLTVKQNEAHDVESFVWVLAYTTMRKLLSQEAPSLERQELKRLFEESYGQLTIDRILSTRISGTPFGFIHNSFLRRNILCNTSSPLRSAYNAFKNGVSFRSIRVPEIKIPGFTAFELGNLGGWTSERYTHEWLHRRLTGTIMLLEADLLNVKKAAEREGGGVEE
ncbi:hypothetical protein EW146_g2276 [Bondarzewia mesenterica]|uniref:Fungal-type protein kinase domain-containing protein n=1 Tax=Bondarzewia mesenterica TaxID=1095465 RepID=A0A4S4M194_9AGAM|nr:hypothetical protein EW146_g2276 [Bondarzewia mesenterica]